MRLICPNCGAQYEVAENVIPLSGRDVECSNCDHAWFEVPAVPVQQTEGNVEAWEWDGDGPEPVAEAYADTTPTPETKSASEPEPELETEPVSTLPPPDWDETDIDDLPKPEEEFSDEDTLIEDEGLPADDLPYHETDDADALEDDAEIAPPLPPAATRPQPRSSVSPEIAEILREEAALEERTRRSEADPLESQPELGLDSAAPRTSEQQAEEARRRMARLRGENATQEIASDGNAPAPITPAPIPPAAPVSRRALLPDIEEINSTLRPTTERAGENAGADSVQAVQEKRRGFRFGFGAVVIIAALMLSIYTSAPRIAAAVPQSEAALTSYVLAVDEARLWIDSQMRNLLDRINGPADASTDEA